MAQSLSQIYLHIVFSTKDRAPFLSDVDFRKHLHRYLGGICKNQDCPALAIGGVADHVHILCRFDKQIQLAELIRELKRDSSAWVKRERTTLHDFHWQAGYGAFSLSPTHVVQLEKYIVAQEEHHKTEDFKEEFRRLCEKYGVPLDERYAWD